MKTKHLRRYVYKMKPRTFTFHIPWRKSQSVFFIALWSQFFFITPFEYITSIDNAISVLFIVISMAIPIIGVWYISTISISNEGIVLYRINKLVWADIVESRKSKFLWFNTIYIKRKKGMPWSLPLYFLGENTIKEALLINVPQDNVLYKVANELPNT